MNEKNQPAKRRKISLFAKIMIGVCAVILVGGGVSLLYLWNYLSNYEETVATAPIDSMFQLLDKGAYSEAMAYGCIDSDYFDSTDSFASYMDGFFDDGKSYSSAVFRKASSEKEDGTVTYSVYSGKTKVFKITVTKSDEVNSIKRNYYKIVSVDFNEIDDISVTVPATAVLTVNKSIIDPTLSKKQVVTEYFGGLKEEKCPAVCTYTLSGYLTYPEISVSDADGTVCKKADNEDGEYKLTYVREISESNVATYSDLTEDASKCYALFVTRNASKYTLLTYILKGTTFYSDMQEYDNKWFGSSTVSFSGDPEVFSICEYDGEHFTAEIKFVQKAVRFGKKETYNLHYVAAFIKSNGKWYMTYLTTVTDSIVDSSQAASSAK